MLLTRPAAPEECCFDCCRKFDPGEHGLMLNPSIGPFIACLDREACQKVGGRPDEALPEEPPEMPPPFPSSTPRVPVGRVARTWPAGDRDRQLVAARVAVVPDFPRPGVQFRDITPLLADARALRAALDLLEDQARSLAPDLVLGVESRGFVFGVPLADRLGLGFLPARKPGKLPGAVVRQTYGKEYGTDALELPHQDLRGKRVVVVDDLLATGGTALAAAYLAWQLGAEVVGYLFLVELESLGGRQRLGATAEHSTIPVRSVLVYP